MVTIRQKSRAFCLAYSSRDSELSPRCVPAEVRGDNIGESKPVVLKSSKRVYCYTHGRIRLPPSMLASDLSQLNWGETGYQNWLWNAEEGSVLKLHYDIRPSKDDATAKNFLLFEHGGDILAITLVNPSHEVYALDYCTGFMSPFASTPCPAHMIKENVSGP